MKRRWLRLGEHVPTALMERAGTVLSNARLDGLTTPAHRLAEDFMSRWGLTVEEALP